MPEHFIITGASRGIGFHTALFLAKQGNYVTAVARSSELLNQLKDFYPEFIFPLPLDITAPAAPEILKRHLDSTKPALSGIIHNAGLLVNKPFTELSSSEWHHQILVNLMAPVTLTRELLPFFNDKGHILHISSMGGFQGSDKFPGLSAYSTTKGALATLTECLAVELTEQNIQVNCLCLGAVQTEMLDQAFPGLQAPVQAEQMGEHIASFALHGNKFYNGKVLPVALNNPS